MSGILVDIGNNVRRLPDQSDRKLDTRMQASSLNEKPSMIPAPESKYKSTKLMAENRASSSSPASATQSKLPRRAHAPKNLRLTVPKGQITEAAPTGAYGQKSIRPPNVDNESRRPIIQNENRGKYNSSSPAPFVKSMDKPLPKTPVQPNSATTTTTLSGRCLIDATEFALRCSPGSSEGSDWPALTPEKATMGTGLTDNTSQDESERSSEHREEDGNVFDLNNNAAHEKTASNGSNSAPTGNNPGGVKSQETPIKDAEKREVPVFRDIAEKGIGSSVAQISSGVSCGGLASRRPLHPRLIDIRYNKTEETSSVSKTSPHLPRFNKTPAGPQNAYNSGSGSKETRVARPPSASGYITSSREVNIQGGQNSLTVASSTAMPAPAKSSKMSMRVSVQVLPQDREQTIPTPPSSSASVESRGMLTRNSRKWSGMDITSSRKSYRSYSVSPVPFIASLTKTHSQSLENDPTHLNEQTNGPPSNNVPSRAFRPDQRLSSGFRTRRISSHHPGFGLGPVLTVSDEADRVIMGAKGASDDEYTNASEPRTVAGSEANQNGATEQIAESSSSYSEDLTMAPVAEHTFQGNKSLISVDDETFGAAGGDAVSIKVKVGNPTHVENESNQPFITSLPNTQSEVGLKRSVVPPKINSSQKETEAFSSATATTYELHGKPAPESQFPRDDVLFNQQTQAQKLHLRDFIHSRLIEVQESTPKIHHQRQASEVVADVHAADFTKDPINLANRTTPQPSSKARQAMSNIKHLFHRRNDHSRNVSGQETTLATHGTTFSMIGSSRLSDVGRRHGSAGKQGSSPIPEHTIDMSFAPTQAAAPNVRASDSQPAHDSSDIAKLDSMVEMVMEKLRAEEDSAEASRLRSVAQVMVQAVSTAKSAEDSMLAAKQAALAASVSYEKTQQNVSEIIALLRQSGSMRGLFRR